MNKFIEYNNEVPKIWARQYDECRPFDLKIPISDNWKTSKNRLLVVCEHVTSEDLKQKKLFSGLSEKVFNACFRLSKNFARNAGYKVPEFATAAINFNFFRTYHLSEKERRKAEISAAKRIWQFIKEAKPTHVLISGDYAAEAILINHVDASNKMLRRKRGWVYEIDGIKFCNTIDYASACSSPSFDGDDSDQDDSAENDSKMSPVYCLGFFSRNMANLLAGEILYSFKTKLNPIIINSIKKFDRMMDILNEANKVAVDTETDAKGRISSKCVVIQFAVDADRGFVLPYMHKDTPFTSKQLEYIKKRLREFFMKRVVPDLKEPKYLIFFNAKFDLTIIRRAFDVPVIYWPVYDARAGEFLLDENLKFLLWYDRKIGYGNLAQTALVYGDDLYFKGETIDKEERSYIATMSIDDPLLGAYCAADVQVLFNIERSQRLRAKHFKYNEKGIEKNYYKDFMAMNILQMSNNIQTFSQMEERGVFLDKAFIKKLLMKDSPINTKLSELNRDFYKRKSVIKANKYLIKKENIQEESFFSSNNNDTTPFIFNIDKPAHKQILFIKVLKLESVGKGKSGDDSLGKEFKKKHKDVKEVSMLEDLEKLKKLKSSYVVPFSKVLLTEDGRIDGRLRPSFDFFPVVTGRSNSSKPSLQQTPQRGENAKFIKRMFAAPPGYLILKNDFSAHEVRMWSVISGDKTLAEVFNVGRKIRQKLVKETDKKKIQEFIRDLMIRGDIHKLNCVAEGSTIITSKGLFSIEDLIPFSKNPNSVSPVNFKVTGKNGLGKALLAKYSGKKSVLSIKTYHGNNLCVTGDHKCLVWDDFSGETLWKKAKDLKIGDKLVFNPKQPKNVSKLKLDLKIENAHFNTKILDTPKYMSEDLAYLLGFITAEGCIQDNRNWSGLLISNNNYEMLEKIQKLLKSVFNLDSSIKLKTKKGTKISISGVKTQVTKDLYSLTASSISLVSLLKQLGMFVTSEKLGTKQASKFKHIPESILKADYKSQASFIAAFIDGDGHISPACLKLHSSSEKLTDQLQSLLMVFGVLSRKTKEKTAFCLSLDGDSIQGLVPYIENTSIKLRDFSFKIKKSRNGIPIDYWRNLLQDRKTGPNTFVTDSGKEIRLTRWRNYTTKISNYSYNCDWVGDKEFKNNLKKISKVAYNKFIRALKYKYVFSEILGIEKAGKKRVYDITIDEKFDPSFSANGYVVHNCEFFYGVKPEDVTKEQRDSIKAVAFGSIYGKSASSLARDLKQEQKEVDKLLSKFFGRFKKASNWLDWTRALGSQTNFTKSCIGRRRHLWGYLVEDKGIRSAMDRRAMNAPIQGLGADIGHTMARLFTIMFWELLYKLKQVDDNTAVHPACTEVMVHDSSRMEVKYEHLLLAAQMMQWIASRGVANYYKKYFNMDFTVLPEIEFEIGPSEDQMFKWNWAMVDYPLCDLEIKKGDDLDSFSLPKVIDLAVDAQLKIYPKLNKKDIVNKIYSPWKNKKLKSYMDKHYPFMPD